MQVKSSWALVYHNKEDGTVAFYSREETLKEFRTILSRQQIVVHTDHANLTYKHFNSDS